MACTCNVGPGKFEGEPARVFMAYAQAMLGNVDLSVGRYDFMRAPFNFDADQSVVRDAREYGYCAECVEAYDAERVWGMAVWTRDDGFVCARTFESENEWDAAIEAAESEETEEGDE